MKALQAGLTVFAVLFLAIAIALSGCAQQAGMTAASAPAARSAGAPDVVPAAADQGARSAVAYARGERPSPGDFVSVSDLLDIHFDFDRSDIRSDMAQALEANARWLNAHPEHLILIEGHADERGTNEYNLALGDRRARTSMSYLVAHGVKATRITIISYGEDRPLCRTHDEGCWRQNRRAHFAVKPQ